MTPASPRSRRGGGDIAIDLSALANDRAGAIRFITR